MRTTLNSSGQERTFRLMKEIYTRGRKPVKSQMRAKTFFGLWMTSQIGLNETNKLQINGPTVLCPRANASEIPSSRECRGSRMHLRVPQPLRRATCHNRPVTAGQLVSKNPDEE